MKRLIVVLLIPVLAQFLVEGWNRLNLAVGQASVDQQNQQYQNEIDKEFPRE